MKLAVDATPGDSTRQKDDTNMHAQPSQQTSIRSLLVFFILAFALSWWPWPLVLLNPDSVALLPWSPLVAALIMAAVVGGRQGLKDLLSRTVRWRVGLK